jgi:type I restriction enzyme S subunit
MTGETPAVHEALAVYAPETTETGRVPEGYKPSEVGVIPEDWEVRRVGEICDFIVPGRNKPREFDGDIPWITTTDLEGRLRVSESKLGLCVSKHEARSVGSQIVPSGSVIMTCVGDLGIVAIVSRDLVMNQQLHAFIPSEVIDATYLSNALKNQKPYMESLSTKTAVPYLNKDNCNSIPIGLPTLHEQRAIAAALSDVDALISALDELIAKKRAVKTAAMQQLLTGKKRLPGFNGEWEERPLGDLAHVNMGQSPSSRNYNARGVGLPLIQGNADIENRRTIARVWTTQITKSCDEGDVVLTVRAPVGYVGIASMPSCLGRGVCSVTPIDVEHKYLFHALIHAEIKWKILEQGSTFTSANSDQISKFRFMCPKSVEEQTAIAAVLSDMDAEIEALEARREKTRQVKRGMMQELLTGRTRLV